MGLDHHFRGGPTSPSAGLPADPRAAGYPVVALAGNPNTGKSTVFNALTGLSQHTGNWPGKTVLIAQGIARHRGRPYTIVDLPGTYSLLASSVEEQVAGDFLCLERPDVTVVVADATCLERNLNLTLQVMEVTDNVVVCVNLVDEAGRKGLTVDTKTLAAELGVPVVSTVASRSRGMAQLMDTVEAVASGALAPVPRRVAYEPEVEEALRRLESQMAKRLPPGVAVRWLAIRALCGDLSVHQLLDRRTRSGSGSGRGTRRGVFLRPAVTTSPAQGEAQPAALTGKGGLAP